MRETKEILYELLATRGIEAQEDISEFLSDRPVRTYDPFLLHNMEAGVDLLLSEIKSGSKLCIYGDYDADGVTSVCILASVIKHLTDNFIFYVPSRFEEGYGLNCDAIRKLHEQNVGIIVTVDCGSVSYDEVEYAKSLGMKIVVTDHHSIDERKADCIMINPKQKECNYPFKNLAGCGIAFKLAQAIQKKTGLPKSVINNTLDLTAIGTVADVVSLTDENRTIVKYGLNKINSKSRQSLAELAKNISIPWITAEDIAYGIAPHINAAGRMKDATEAIKLFLSEDMDEIDKQVRKLIDFNTERKQEQESAYREGLLTADDREDFIVVKMEDIHEGIAGIVAGKLKEYFERPVVVVTPSGEGFLKGTGRSIESVNLYKILKKCDSLFIKFGGHASACGFLMKEENLQSLREMTNQEIKSLQDENPHIFDKNIFWDMELTPAEVSVELAEELEKLEPCGEGNPKPVFKISNVVLENVIYMGDEGTHARFKACSSDGESLDCILFRRAQDFRRIFDEMKPVDIIGSVRVKKWRGRVSVQFNVEEIV